MRRYVIIGNSAAGIGAIEGIRSQDEEGQIAVIGEEPHHVYSRPLISYLLEGKTDTQRMKYRPDDFYERNRVETHLGHRAVSIDPDEQQVELDDGTRIAYDALFLGTGSRPFVPPIEGLDGVSRVHTFMTLDEALSLADDLKDPKRVLIVGAGLIGLKCAEGIRSRCSELTVVDVAPHVLPSILDEEGAAIIEDVLKSQGIRLCMGKGVSRFEGDMAMLSDGSSIPFDIAVIAVGVRPNTEIYPEKASPGIPTDVYGRTEIPGIYAGGDCAMSHDIVADADRILALLPNAYMQGHAAGVHMSGGREAYDRALAANAMGLFGTHMITAGSQEGDVQVFRDGDTYKKLVTEDGLLKGFIMIGDVRNAGIYTALIRDRKPLGEIDFALVSQRPSLMAFSLRERQGKLRGNKQPLPHIL